jgi:hypothetical protein
VPHPAAGAPRHGHGLPTNRVRCLESPVDDAFASAMKADTSLVIHRRPAEPWSLPRGDSWSSRSCSADAACCCPRFAGRSRDFRSSAIRTVCWS